MPGKAKTKPVKPKPTTDGVPRDIADDARDALLRVADEGGLTVDMVAVANARTIPQTYDAPIAPDLAEELLKRCRDSARTAANSELREAQAGFRPDNHQQIYSLVPEALRKVDDVAKIQTQAQLDGTTKLGSNNMLVIRVHTSTGQDLARFYQSLASDRDLEIARRRTLWWNSGQFTQLTERPLILDKTFGLAVVDDIAVMANSSSYEKLFGPMPELKEQAKKTYSKTLAKLNIVGADELKAACENDINMMRKLVSIERKLARPGYSGSLTQAKLVAFVQSRPTLGIEIRGKGTKAALVFAKDPQHRWQLLKLLDDDNLHSTLTGVDYEANSKSEIG